LLDESQFLFEQFKNIAIIFGHVVVLPFLPTLHSEEQAAAPLLELGVPASSRSNPYAERNCEKLTEEIIEWLTVLWKLPQHPARKPAIEAGSLSKELSIGRTAMGTRLALIGAEPEERSLNFLLPPRNVPLKNDCGEQRCAGQISTLKVITATWRMAKLLHCHAFHHCTRFRVLID
jgi:hypothetical protein